MLTRYTLPNSATEPERPLRTTRIGESGLGRAVWLRPPPVRQSSAGAETRGSPADAVGPRKPTWKPRPSGTAVRGVHPQGCHVVVRRWQPARHGSEQRTTERPSLDGSRGGEGDRDYPAGNAGRPRASTFISRFSIPTSRRLVLAMATLAARRPAVGTRPSPVRADAEYARTVTPCARRSQSTRGTGRGYRGRVAPGRSRSRGRRCAPNRTA